MTACTLMLNKLRCYLTLNMDFVEVCLHQLLSMIFMKIYWKIVKKNTLLVLYFVIFLKHLIQLTTAYSYTNLNTFMELQAYP